LEIRLEEGPVEEGDDGRYSREREEKERKK
jgi:hypothetical protein